MLDVMGVFNRKKWAVMILGALVGAAVGYSVTLAIRPSYRAQCLLEPVGAVSCDALVAKLLRSSLQTSVSEKLSGDKRFFGSSLNVGRSLSATGVPGGLIRLRCTGCEPLICERVLELLLDEYRGNLIERESREDEEEIRLIRNRISEYTRAAAANEEALHDFMAKYDWLDDYAGSEEGIVAVYDKRERVHAGNARELAKLEKEWAKARKRRDKIGARIDKEEKHVVTEMVKELNPDVIHLSGELLVKQKMLRQLLVDSSDNHPMVKRFRKEIEGTKKMIAEQPREIIKEQKVSINPVYRKLTADLFDAGNEVDKIAARMAKLRENIDQYKRGERDIPPGEWKRIVEFEKERIKNEELLESLRARLAAIRGSDNGRDTGVIEFRVIDPPVSEEVLPDRRAIVAVAALIGLILGAVLPIPSKRKVV